MRNTLIIIIALSLFLVLPVLADEMASDKYLIQRDSINIGGVLSTTSNYRIDDTIGEVATGISTTSDYQVKAGYQQMDSVYISISVPSDINMSPNVQQLSGGQSDGSGTATVITDSSSGYNLTIKAGASPALSGATDSFADYIPQTAGTPDFTWAISASDSSFGFSVEGSDIVQLFQDDGASCNTGSGDISDACWYNLSTSETTIAQSASSNQPSGAGTTLKFKAESDSSHNQTAGAYQANITLTALAN